MRMGKVKGVLVLINFPGLADSKKSRESRCASGRCDWTSPRLAPRRNPGPCGHGAFSTDYRQTSSMASPKRTISNEDYLERIRELTQNKGYARAVDLASALNVRPASVTMMVQRLAAAGYLNYERYRGMTLTRKGQEVAEMIHRRHIALSRLLNILEIEPETRERDIEGIEHHVSEETLSALTILADILEENTGWMASFRRRRTAIRCKRNFRRA